MWWSFQCRMRKNASKCGNGRFLRNVRWEKMVLEIMTSAAVLAITMILIVSELLIFGRGQEKRRAAVAAGGDKTCIPVAMLRIQVFLIFFITNIPKAFLPIYIMKQAETESVFGLSPAMLVSIALSSEVSEEERLRSLEVYYLLWDSACVQ